MTGAGDAAKKYPKFTGSVICGEPAILLQGIAGGAHSIGIAGLDELLRAREAPIYLFLTPMWTFSDPGFAGPVVKALNEAARTYPNHRYALLLNDSNDIEYLQALDSAVRRYIWNTNCVVDVNLFHVAAETAEPAFDAVYVARPASYKRLALARKIERLVLLARALDDKRYAEVREILPHAEIPNVQSGKFVTLGSAEVAGFFARSPCGLMLSKFEGQNRATIEYLLCGLPVVTTANRGGRDRFLHPGNSVFAESTADGVAEAVKRARSIGFDRAEIRRDALSSIAHEQRCLVAILNEVLARDGLAPVSLSDLTFSHKASSAVRALPYFFTELGLPVPPVETFVREGRSA